MGGLTAGAPFGQPEDMITRTPTALLLLSTLES